MSTEVPTPEQLAAVTAQLAAGQALADHLRAVDYLMFAIAAEIERTETLDDLLISGQPIRRKFLAAFPAGGAR